MLGFTSSSSYSFLGIFVAMLIYAISYLIAKNFMNIKLGEKESRKLITTGIGTFIMLFLFFWILLNTFMQFV
jgi:hypothetical protein